MTVRSDPTPLLAALLAAAIAATPGSALAGPEAAKKAAVDGPARVARCLAYAATQKLTPLSVAVVDASGALLAFERQAGASPATAEVALLKAQTAVRLHAPTALLGPAAAADAGTRDLFLALKMITIAGGVPYSDANGQVVGAVGVSGATAEQDAACAGQAAGG